MVKTILRNPQQIENYKGNMKDAMICPYCKKETYYKKSSLYGFFTTKVLNLHKCFDCGCEWETRF